MGFGFGLGFGLGARAPRREVYGRYRGDIGEIQGRYRGGMATSCACAVAGLEACRLPRGRSASTCAMPWAASLIASELRLRWATW